jgi:hypothetical protein
VAQQVVKLHTLERILEPQFHDEFVWVSSPSATAHQALAQANRNTFRIMILLVDLDIKGFFDND